MASGKPSEDLLGDGGGEGMSEETLISQRLQQLVEGSGFNWIYGIAWQLSMDEETEETMLGWCDGYFKGSKELEAIDRAEHDGPESEAQVMRKRVMHELRALVCGDEDEESADEESEYITDLEWFYLVSMSFSFQRGVGTPGKALENGDHVWLLGANKVSKAVCLRSDLAKMAGIQTIVCVLTKHGVVELGSTDLISSNGELVLTIKAMFDEDDEEWTQSGHDVSSDEIPLLDPAMSKDITKLIPHSGLDLKQDSESEAEISRKSIEEMKMLKLS